MSDRESEPVEIKPGGSVRPEEDAELQSFGAEVKELLGGLGWGLRWFGLSAAWGLALFTLIVLVGRIIVGAPIENPGPYYGLTVIVALITIIFSIVRRQFRE